MTGGSADELHVRCWAPSALQAVCQLRDRSFEAGCQRLQHRKAGIFLARLDFRQVAPVHRQEVRHLDLGPAARLP